MPLHLDRLELKQLRILLVLARTRNTYRAAEQLHLSQSAVSRALARLRESLDDPVFIRTPSGLEPTALTERLVARLPEMLDLLADAVDEGSGFKASEWRAEVNGALSSHVSHCWGQKIYQALSKAAPRVTWNFHSWRSSSNEDLIDGQTDFGLHFFNESRDQSLFQHPLCNDPFVLLARQGHPVADRVLHRKNFSQYGLVSLLLPDWNEYGNVLEASLLGIGEAPRIALRVESLALALQCLQESDHFMAGTRELANNHPELLALELPSSLEVPVVPVVLCYPRRLRQSAKIRWLTETLENAF